MDLEAELCQLPDEALGFDLDGAFFEVGDAKVLMD